MSFSARAVHSRDSSPMVLLAIEDVSARKQVEAERKRLLAEAQHAREAAEQANRTKDAFLATLSHELRTPLATMMMNAQLLRHADLRLAKVQRASEAIERSAKTQSQLIEDLLDVSRIVTGKLELDLRRLSLPGVVQAALEAVAAQAERKHIGWRSTSTAAGLVSGDSLRLQQVVSNLLTNAVKFTPDSGRVKVVLGSGRRRRGAPRHRSRAAGSTPIPCPSSSIGSPSRRTPASGASAGSVWVCRSSATSSRCTVGRSARRVPGRGWERPSPSRFPCCAIRTRPRSGAQVLSLAEARPAALELSRLRGLRVLVVDDDAEALEAVSEMLRLNGADVIAAISAEEALRAAQESGLQVIISDIAMPGTDGYSLIQSIRALPAADQASVPAIALTAAAGANARKRSLEAGFQEYLEKPVDIGRLARALVELSRSRHSA